MGIRTYAADSLGSCCFGLISTYAAGEHDPGRIAAQVVSGIGFLGAGVILRERGQVKGLTTAATLWATASVGMAVSFGMYILGVLSSMFLFVLLSMGQLRDDVDEEDEPWK